jgi:hypothetical protein
MSNRKMISGSYAGAALWLALTAFAASSCGTEDVDTPAGPEAETIAPGARTPGLTPAACATFARGGSISICHSAGAQAVPGSALTVTTETCAAAHVGHPGDFVADDETGCVQERTCKVSGKTCRSGRPGDCCSFNCNCPVGQKKCVCG